MKLSIFFILFAICLFTWGRLIRDRDDEYEWTEGTAEISAVVEDATTVEYRVRMVIDGKTVSGHSVPYKRSKVCYCC